MSTTKNIAWNTGSGNIILTYQGQGNGTIIVSSDDNNGAARSQVITVETLDGVKSVNLTVNQAACPVPVGTVLNYAYTGSYQEVELPAGEYKLQCWGAQGGSNGTNSTYGITAQAGGKGGYSEGTITLTQKTTLRVYVGGQGSSSAGGYNGGGSTTGTSQYNTNNESGYSKMGGGGGATDIRLSDGALLSRMIVAGGGNGGAMCYQYKQETVTSYETKPSITREYNPYEPSIAMYGVSDDDVGLTPGKTYKFSLSGGSVVAKLQDAILMVVYRNSNNTYLYQRQVSLNSDETLSYSGAAIINMYVKLPVSEADPSAVFTIGVQEKVSSQVTTTTTNSQVGYVGGGTTGGGYSSTYKGRQNAAGSSGSFGQGANQTVTNYRYCSAAGGGGWYGGGYSYSDSDIDSVKKSGGGSGFVNTADNAQYRPSGYTGLQLDSGTTYAGSSSFPSTGGGTESGHSGNGYARITRLA